MHSSAQGRCRRYCGGNYKLNLMDNLSCLLYLFPYFKLVFIDVSRPTILAPHPMHMHGHKFFVVAMERHVDNITLGTWNSELGTSVQGGYGRPKISKTHIPPNRKICSYQGVAKTSHQPKKLKPKL